MASKALHASWMDTPRRQKNARALSLTPWPLSEDVCRRRQIFGEESRSAPSRSPKSVGKDRSVLRVLWRLQTFVCDQRGSRIAHIYPSVLQAVPGGLCGVPGEGDSKGIGAGICKILHRRGSDASDIARQFLALDGETGHMGPNFAFCLPGRMGKANN